MPTIHGNVPEDRAETDIMDHLTMGGLNAPVLDYVRISDERREVQLKSSCGMKVIIAMTKRGVFDVTFA